MVKINLSISSFEIQGIKKFVFKAIFLLPLLMIITATNFFVDPAHLYENGKLEKGIADILSSGQNVGVVSNFDDRLIQKFRIVKLARMPDIVIIGSSRSMQIGSNVFQDKYVINNAMPDATLGDYLGILFNYDKNNEWPRTIILGVDPWVINSKSGEYRWESFKEDTFAMLKKLNIPSGDLKETLITPQLANIISISYFQQSVKKIFEKKSRPNEYFATNLEIGSNYDVLLKDGRRSYNMSCRIRSAKEVEKFANTEIKDQNQDFQFREPDPKWENILEKLVIYLQSRHVDVVFYLAPYHPLVYSSFLVSSQNKIIVDIENYYKDFAKRHMLRIIGSYDPSKANLSDKDFYDGEHPTKEAVEKIFGRAW